MHEDNNFPIEEINKPEIYEAIKKRVKIIGDEFYRAFDLIKDYPKSVTFFGSARVREGNQNYEKARHLAGRIVKELGYAVISGGGGGIMEASNRGAFENGGQSIGLNIRLPKEQDLNRYTTESLELHHFFTRKVALSFAAEAYIFFPGGFGTMDEFFEIVTLIQTRKIPQVPIILFDKGYWEPIDRLIQEIFLSKYGTIDKEDSNLYIITDNEDEIIEIIKMTPVRQGLK